MIEANDRFLDAFEEVTRHAKEAWGEEHGPGGRPNSVDAVWRLVAAGRLERHHACAYEDLKPLRDSLAHARINGQTLLRVSDQSLMSIEAIRDRLCGKVTTVATMKRDVVTAESGMSLAEACELMARLDLSCLPVVGEAGLQGLLSADDLISWVGHNLGTIGLIEDATVGEVMSAHTSLDYRVVSRTTPCRDIPAMFAPWSAEGCNLGAVLITATGHPHEPLLGIITPWDLPRIVR